MDRRAFLKAVAAAPLAAALVRVPPARGFFSGALVTVDASGRLALAVAGDTIYGVWDGGRVRRFGVASVAVALRYDSPSRRWIRG